MKSNLNVLPYLFSLHIFENSIFFSTLFSGMTISIVIMHVTISVLAIYGIVSSSNLIFLSLTPTFHKIDKKTFKGIMLSLYVTTFVNIPPEIRYLVNRSNYI